MRGLQYNQDLIKEIVKVYSKNIGDIEVYNSPKHDQSNGDGSSDNSLSRKLSRQNNGASGGSFLDENQRSCCSIGMQALQCACEMEIYQIRPYTLEILEPSNVSLKWLLSRISHSSFYSKSLTK